MVGITESDDIMIIGIVVLFPLLLIIGIPVLLANLGANPLVVFLGAIVNIGIVGLLMYYFNVFEFLHDAIDSFSQ